MTAVRQLSRQLTVVRRRVKPWMVVVGVIAAYVLGLLLPGTEAYLDRNAPLGIVAVGAIIGSVTALLAIGLILIYRANRFINFAYGSMGSLVGVLAIGMHKEHGWNYFLAIGVGAVAGVIVGAGIDRLIIRRFANSSRLVLTVASIGLAQLLGGLELLGSKAIGFTSLTGGFSVPNLDISIDLGVKTLKADEVLIMSIVPIVIAALAWFLLKTDSGVAVRAAAESADRARLLGIPVRRLSTIVWAIAGGLAALTFVLKAPFAGVAPGVASTGPTVLLPALAAAVVARMESLPIAVGAGIGLGILEQVIRWNSTTPSFNDLAFFVVILAALLLQRDKLSRGQDTGTSTWTAVGNARPIPTELRHLPEVRWAGRVVVLLVAVAAALLPAAWSPSRQLLAGYAVVWAMVGVSLVVLTGWGGSVSLGQFALVGVGAMVAGNFITRWNTDGVLVLIVSGIAGAIVALLVGLPALRIRGLFLAVTTLAFAVALDSYVLNLNNFPDYIPQAVERPLLWERFNLDDNYAMYLFSLALLALSVIAAIGVRRARSGRVLVASRDNRRAAGAAAVPTTRVQLSGFLLAGVIAGVAGALHVQFLHGLNPGTYAPNMSMEVFATAVIGGLGSLAGALSGIVLFQYLQSITALGDVRLLLTGTGLLVVLYALPGGFGQVFISIRDRLLRRVAARRGLLVPSLVADKRVDEGGPPPQEAELLEQALV
jgi:branched-chain amino acid transport system permease protein